MATIPSPHRSGPAAPPPSDVAIPAAVRPGPSRHGEHSRAARRPASAVPSIKALRISPPGFRATLVNISASGLLAEWGLPLKTGQAVTVAFEGTIPPQSVGAQVIRVSIASMTTAGLRYYVGLAFTAPITFEEQAPPATGAAKAPAPAAIADPAPLDDVVNRW
jgi:hypothetical protein